MTTPVAGVPAPMPLRSANFASDARTTIPADVVSGDLIIIFHHAAAASNENATTIAAGFVSIAYSKKNGVSMSTMMAKVSDGTEGGLELAASTHGTPYSAAALVYDAGITSFTQALVGYSENSKAQLVGLTVPVTSVATRPLVMISAFAADPTSPSGNLIYTPSVADETHGTLKSFFKTNYFASGSTPSDQIVSINGDFGVQTVCSAMLELT